MLSAVARSCRSVPCVCWCLLPAGSRLCAHAVTPATEGPSGCGDCDVLRASPSAQHTDSRMDIRSSSSSNRRLYCFPRFQHEALQPCHDLCFRCYWFGSGAFCAEGGFRVGSTPRLLAPSVSYSSVLQCMFAHLYPAHNRLPCTHGSSFFFNLLRTAGAFCAHTAASQGTSWSPAVCIPQLRLQAVGVAPACTWRRLLEAAHCL